MNGSIGRFITLKWGLATHGANTIGGKQRHQGLNAGGVSEGGGEREREGERVEDMEQDTRA